MKTHLVTCGPSSEAIDAVRRLTNFSTGELGVLLSEKLAEKGHRVVCCKGVGATWPDPVGCETVRFVSNDDLLEILGNLAREESFGAIFHAAALADFKVKEVSDGKGQTLESAKIPSTLPELVVRLVPSRKVLPLLRDLFPLAKIIGWKYEADGTPEEALEKGRQQIRSSSTDGCVVNGPAYGSGFGILLGEHLHHVANKAELAEFLASS